MNTQNYRLVAAVAFITLAACGPDDTFVSPDMNVLPDMTADMASDLGVDMGEDVSRDQGGDDMGEMGGDMVEACPGGCSGMKPVCDVSAKMCVGCLIDGDCTGDKGACRQDTKTCVQCIDSSTCTTAGQTVCNAATNTCVACVDNSHCTESAASKCASNTCVACAASPDCAHIPGKTVCDSGACKQCSKDDDSACNGNSCDLSTGTCTTTPKGSADVCDSCKADSECSDGFRCVPMNFNGQPHGSYCLLDDAIGDCEQPFGTLLERTSLGGVSSIFCGVNEALTTCEAVRDLRSNKACAGVQDHASCGAPGLDDARCVNVSAVGNPNFRCSYRCDTDAQCVSSQRVFLNVF
jgi:hypothetical protein